MHTKPHDRSMCIHSRMEIYKTTRVCIHAYFEKKIHLHTFVRREYAYIIVTHPTIAQICFFPVIIWTQAFLIRVYTSRLIRLPYSHRHRSKRVRVSPPVNQPRLLLDAYTFGGSNRSREYRYGGSNRSREYRYGEYIQ